MHFYGMLKAETTIYATKISSCFGLAKVLSEYIKQVYTNSTKVAWFDNFKFISAFISVQISLTKRRSLVSKGNK